MPSSKIAEWKKCAKTREAHKELFNNKGLLTKITITAFKSYQVKDVPVMHSAYVLAICDIILNPKNSGIKCNDKAVLKRVKIFTVIYIQKF